jgi:UDP-N-acetyl-D-glucosamine dehydrogenase
MKNKIIRKIKNQDSTIGIIGLGYVGLPLFIRFSEKGFKVIGFDVDDVKVNSINQGVSYINHIESNKVKDSISLSIATNEFSQISNVDVIIICVPTPLGIHNEPDLSYIKSTLKSISPFLKNNQVLILESTTYPCTTEEEVVPFINNLGFEIGKNYFIGYSPEREDPGNKNFSTKTIPKVISGVTNNCLQIIECVYSQIVDKTVPVSSPKVAEMTKILENIHRAVNIGLVNELKMVAEKLNIDIYEVINAAATKPFGFTPYYPGPGLGGHCIPIDPFFLTWKAKEIGMNTRFIELAGEINTSMPNYVVKKTVEALNEKGNSIKGSRILVLGLSYKKNVDDTRESPSLVIINELISMGARVKYSDPFLPESPITRKFNFNLKSIELNKKSISSFDLVILATEHDSYDYDLIKKYSKLIIDTRGHYKNVNKVIRA